MLGMLILCLVWVVIVVVVSSRVVMGVVWCMVFFGWVIVGLF